MGTGAGLGALGFWIMIASVIVAGIWYDIRKREAQHETIRRLIESGQAIDEKLLDKLLGAAEGNSRQSRRELKGSMRLASVIVLSVAPGLALLGLFIGEVLVMMGVAALILCVGLGLKMVADNVDRWYGEDDEGTAESELQ